MAKEVESILSKLLLPLQLSLGFWQFIKLTPVGAVIRGIAAWLLRPFGLSTAYARLHSRPGHIFKEVVCIKMLPSDETTRLDMDANESKSVIRATYLGVDFHLERKSDMLFVDGKMAFYITNVNWYYLRLMDDCLRDSPNKVVFLKSYKQLWEQVATGRVMSLAEVLDCLIVENYTMKFSKYNDWLLPVDLSVSEEKLLKVINLAGLFLQTKKAFGVIPTVLSLTSAVLEFNAPLRVWIYGRINLVFCWAMHFICDKLPYSRRKHVYCLGNWVENLKPSNDIELKVVKGNICAVIGGGAKTHREGADPVRLLSCPDWIISFNFPCGHINIQCDFDVHHSMAKLYIRTGDGSTIGQHDVTCGDGRSDFIKVCTFIGSVAKNRCGSLKSHGRNSKVHVRSLMDSLICYVLNGFPPVYELSLKNVVIQ